MGQHIQGKVSAQGQTSSPVEEDQEGGMERNMNPRLNHAIMLLAALLAIALVGCGQAGQEELPTTTTPTEWNLDEPKPISSNSAVTMTTEEILEITGEYMAVNLWAQTAHRTADEHPESFHQMLFSDPPRGCVEEHRDLLEVMPTPPVEKLIACSEANAAEGLAQDWSQIEPDEREARARRSVGLLFWSLDPPTLMSVMIANRKGLDVSVRTNPAFAVFAAKYNVCEEESGRFVTELAQAKTPEQMAEIWLRSERGLKACSDTVTSSLFDRREP